MSQTSPMISDANPKMGRDKRTPLVSADQEKTKATENENQSLKKDHAS
jgi:hypothetical protein